MTDDRLDRYARRELPPKESRDLAQKSLDDRALFDELTDTSLAQSGLSKRAVGAAKVVRFPRKTRFVAAVAAVAAAVIVLLLIRSQPSTPDRSPDVAATPGLKPALPAAAQAGQPILLTADLQSSPVFRGAEPDSRPPRRTGSIVSIDDGLASIDLGSLDGLAKGSELGVFRDARPIGRLEVTAVFRERARCRIVEGGPRVQRNSDVRAADADHLTALMDQVDALSSRGDSDGTRRMAEEAMEWARAANVPPADKQRALDRLAALEAAALNRQAVGQIQHDNYDDAEASLRRAISISPKAHAAYARCANNLGTLTEWRGDRRKAAEFYEDAQRALAGAADATAEDRQAVEANLSRARGAR